MNSRYIDLIDLSFDPIEGFEVVDGCLLFHGIPIKQLIEKHGTPLRLTYLPRISAQINKAKRLFNKAIVQNDYKGKYFYCFCTKSSHFSFVLNEALKNDIHLELSSNYDIDLLNELYKRNKINQQTYIVCNGFKTKQYIKRISELINNGFSNTIPVIDNISEINFYDNAIEKGLSCQLGIRVAAEEEPTFEFYTSRLGLRYKDVLDFYKEKIMHNPKFELKMLHFFINTGIRDEAYYWNELSKLLDMYCALKKICPSLSMINIGGGMPIRYALDDIIDYDYLINEIVNQIKKTCNKEGVPTPDIFSEFGNYTVGESGALIFKVLAEKKQNDREKWYMLDGSLMTTLPDIYGVKQRYILLPINKWLNDYQTVIIGGLSCDGNDFYSSDIHQANLYLPQIKKEEGSEHDKDDEPLYLGFFHVGAYQESLSGYGGIKHCLIPAPKHILVRNTPDKEGYRSKEFAPQQDVQSMLKFLGY